MDAVCHTCGQAFVANRRTQRYCSKLCRETAKFATGATAKLMPVVLDALVTAGEAGVHKTDLYALVFVEDLVSEDHVEFQLSYVITALRREYGNRLVCEAGRYILTDDVGRAERYRRRRTQVIARYVGNAMHYARLEAEHWPDAYTQLVWERIVKRLDLVVDDLLDVATMNLDNVA